MLTAQEAAAYERQTLERQATTNITAGPDWWDPGTRFLTNGRTSLIVDPPDGRVPAMTPRRSSARRRARRRAARAARPTAPKTSR